MRLTGPKQHSRYEIWLWSALLAVVAILVGCGGAPEGVHHMSAQAVAIAAKDLPTGWKSCGSLTAGHEQSDRFWRCVGLNARQADVPTEVGPTWFDDRGHVVASSLLRYASMAAASSAFAAVSGHKGRRCYLAFLQDGVRQNRDVVSSTHWSMILTPGSKKTSQTRVLTTYAADFADIGPQHVIRYFFWIRSGSAVATLELYSAGSGVNVHLEQRLLATIGERLRLCAKDSRCLPGVI
jgi:hypothetical protein